MLLTAEQAFLKEAQLLASIEVELAAIARSKWKKKNPLERSRFLWEHGVSQERGRCYYRRGEEVAITLLEACVVVQVEQDLHRITPVLENESLSTDQEKRILFLTQKEEALMEQRKRLEAVRAEPVQREQADIDGADEGKATPKDNIDSAIRHNSGVSSSVSSLSRISIPTSSVVSIVNQQSVVTEGADKTASLDQKPFYKNPKFYMKYFFYLAIGCFFGHYFLPLILSSVGPSLFALINKIVIIVDIVSAVLVPVLAIVNCYVADAEPSKEPPQSPARIDSCSSKTPLWQDIMYTRSGRLKEDDRFTQFIASRMHWKDGGGPPKRIAPRVGTVSEGKAPEFS